MKQALEEGQFEMYYQPIIALWRNQGGSCWNDQNCARQALFGRFPPGYDSLQKRPPDQVAFYCLAPHRGRISNHLHCADAGGSGGFRGGP